MQSRLTFIDGRTQDVHETPEEIVTLFEAGPLLRLTTGSANVPIFVNRSTVRSWTKSASSGATF